MSLERMKAMVTIVNRGEGIALSRLYAQLGVQLIGHAVSVFRALGRRAVRLHVFSGNTGALRFYEEYGFRRIGEAAGANGTLYLMEKEL